MSLTNSRKMKEVFYWLLPEYGDNTLHLCTRSHWTLLFIFLKPEGKSALWFSWCNLEQLLTVIYAYAKNWDITNSTLTLQIPNTRSVHAPLHYILLKAEIHYFQTKFLLISMQMTSDHIILSAAQLHDIQLLKFSPDL